MPHVVVCPMDFSLLGDQGQQGGVLKPTKNDRFQVFLAIWVFFLNILGRLKVESASFLLVCIVSLKESTCAMRKNVFHFTSKTLFVLQVLNFQIFKCHDVIKSLNMKHETHFIE